MDAECSKCVKFENGLHPKIKQFIDYQEILRFSVLVNKSMIYDEDSRARSTHYKILGEKKVSNQNSGKPYVSQCSKETQRPVVGNRTSEGGAHFPQDVLDVVRQITVSLIARM